MKAIVVEREESGPVLEWQEVADIASRPDEVMVDIYSSAVNRADLAQAAGSYPPPKGESDILGLEMSGVITSIGKGVTKWKPGDKVFALLAGGGYAEQAAVHQDMLLEIPEGWSFHHAAAIPEVWLTAYVNLFLEGKLAQNETVLIHAGASGVGTAAIQLAKSVGSTIFVTVGSSRKQTACLQLGADLAVNYKQADFYEKITAVLDGHPVDLILDPIGGPYLESNIKLLGEFGRFVSIGALAGREGTLDLGLVLANRLKIIGSRLRNRPLKEKIEISHGLWDRFQPHFLTGVFRPIVDTILPIEKAQEAHDYVRQNKNIGKVVLAVRS